MPNLDLIDEQIRKEFSLKCDYEIINKAEIIKTKFIESFKQRILEIFSDPEKIKFRLKISNKHLYANSSLKVKVFNSISRRILKNIILFKIFCPNLLYKIDFSYSNKLLKSITTDGTLSNNLIKSIFGILASLVLTLILYLYLRYQLLTEVNDATFYIILTFIILIYGLVFNKNSKFRAIVLLMIPFMASNRTRAVLILNCCVISKSILLPNIIQNLGSLQESYICNLNIFSDQVEDHANKNENAIKIKKMMNNAKKIRKNAIKKANELKKTQKKMLSYSMKIKAYLDKVASLCSSADKPVESCKKGMSKIVNDCLSKSSFWIDCKAIEAAEEVCSALNGPQAVCVGSKKAASKVKEKFCLF